MSITFRQLLFRFDIKLLYTALFTIAILDTGVHAQGLPDDTSYWFPFESDGNYAESILNMSHWLDAPAGHRGFLQMEGDRFVFEDGTRVRGLWKEDRFVQAIDG